MNCYTCKLLLALPLLGGLTAEWTGRGKCVYLYGISALQNSAAFLQHSRACVGRGPRRSPLPCFRKQKAGYLEEEVPLKKPGGRSRRKGGRGTSGLGANRDVRGRHGTGNSTSDLAVQGQEAMRRKDGILNMGDIQAYF